VYRIALLRRSPCDRERWPAWCIALLAGGILVVVGLAAAERRDRPGVAPLLRTATFSNVAFSAGLAVQLLFSVGLQGFSLSFTLWVQDGHGYSPLHTGVTLLAFSAGAMVTAPNAGKLALTHGRIVLVAGGLLMAIGTLAIGAPAWLTSGSHLSAWWLVPGMVVSGAGLGLLVVPLVNVVLAAVPADVAGGASGLFTTAQQLGGAMGVAVIGGVFLDHFHPGPSDHAFRLAILLAAGCSVLCTALSGLLPRTAVSDEAVIDAG
jgi:MFS family permease